ncbi:MAG: hypothetical protein Q8N88_06970 [Nanoarchaeota archaeon]|nr:hypothetical protein [Nanoarchaeota archaeon]
MTQIISPALEIMVVDDEEDWRNDLEGYLEGKGYAPFMCQNSFSAIEQVSRRFCTGENLPFMYLSDVLDSNTDNSAGVVKACGEFKVVYRNIALDLHQFLQGRCSQILLSPTCNISPEDREIAERFSFPLITKSDEDLGRYPLNIKDCLTSEEAAKRFLENYVKVTGRDKIIEC